MAQYQHFDVVAIKHCQDFEQLNLRYALTLDEIVWELIKAVPTQVLAPDIASDGQQPCLERCISPEGVDAPQRPEKRVLRAVLGIASLETNASKEIKYSGLVFA